MRTPVTFSAETDGEFCCLSCPALEARGRTIARTCAVFRRGDLLREDYVAPAGVSFRRHPECVDGEIDAARHEPHVCIHPGNPKGM